MPSHPAGPGLLRAARHKWKETADRLGFVEASREMFAALWYFVRDSTPERRRSRYGDADYDWDHRVNTTSGGVGWRDRLLGILHSPYQPTESSLFHEIVEALTEKAKIDLAKFTFIDLGSGKGRVLLMAADYPFRRVIGVELLPALHEIALENLRKYQSESQKCFALEAVRADATEFIFAGDPTVLFLFNPFPESGLRKLLANLDQSLRTSPRRFYVLYHNPELEHVLSEHQTFTKLCGTHQYSIYTFAEGSRLV